MSSKAQSTHFSDNDVLTDVLSSDVHGAPNLKINSMLCGIVWEDNTIKESVTQVKQLKKCLESETVLRRFTLCKGLCNMTQKMS